MHQNKKYLAAVSGGPDSMALLNKYKDNVYGVCHINYHYRKTANRDEEIVRSYCDKHNILFYCLSIDSNIYQSSKIKNFENWARKTRYDFFIKIAKKIKLDTILIGHNLDDWLETAIMQQNKNTKTLYYGIKKNNNYQGLNIERPLISFRKKTLEQYCISNHIEYGIDETNFDLRYSRNKIRNEISKLSNNEFKQKINYFNQLNNEKNELNKNINLNYKEWKNKQYSIEFLKKQKSEFWTYLIYQFFIDNDIKRISKNKIDNVISFIKADNRNSIYRLGNNIFLRKLNNSLIIERTNNL